MELKLGPFDPALHVRSRDHYEAVRREAKLAELGSGNPPANLDELLERIAGQLGTLLADEAAERAFLAGESSFTATVEVPAEQVPSVRSACDEFERLLEELERCVREAGASLLEAPEDVKRYRREFVRQLRVQLASQP